MKIAVISDTHITKPDENFKDLLKSHFQDVDMIIHAGDFTSAPVLNLLKVHKPLVGVRGNVDDVEVRTLLQEKEVITVKGYRIGIFHGDGKGGSTFLRAYEKFKDTPVDIIVFGHSHQPLMKTKNGILMLNPGSLTRKRREPWFSYVLLELGQGAIDVQFKLFSGNLLKSSPR